MRRGALEHGVLTLWAGCAALALWAPAMALPLAGLPLQPMDLLVLAGWPLIAVFARHIPSLAVAAVLLGVLSMMASWTLNGGEPVILAWSLGFALPWVLLAALVVSVPRAAGAFVSMFLTGAAASATFFLVQIAVGAELLDFRNNPAFRLPPHYGRGFALFPEVSTFAVHAVIAISMALALALHPATPRPRRRRMVALTLLLALALLFSRSTSVVVLLPLVVSFALAKTTRANLNTLVLAVLVLTALTAALLIFLQSFYIERLETSSASRSAAMRLASILGGLTPLVNGEVFGVGIGKNALVGERAFQAARALGLAFGALPDGVNAQLVGRIFEEGWPALIQAGFAAIILVAAFRRARGPDTVALVCLAGGSLLAASMAVGYRGIYTVWLWLALPAGLLVSMPDRPGSVASQPA